MDNTLPINRLFSIANPIWQDMAITNQGKEQAIYQRVREADINQDGKITYDELSTFHTEQVSAYSRSLIDMPGDAHYAFQQLRQLGGEEAAAAIKDWFTKNILRPALPYRLISLPAFQTTLQTGEETLAALGDPFPTKYAAVFEAASTYIRDTLREQDGFVAIASEKENNVDFKYESPQQAGYLHITKRDPTHTTFVPYDASTLTQQLTALSREFGMEHQRYIGTTLIQFFLQAHLILPFLRNGERGGDAATVARTFDIVIGKQGQFFLRFPISVHFGSALLEKPVVRKLAFYHEREHVQDKLAFALKFLAKHHHDVQQIFANVRKDPTHAQKGLQAFNTAFVQVSAKRKDHHYFESATYAKELDYAFTHYPYLQQDKQPEDDENIRAQKRYIQQRKQYFLKHFETLAAADQIFIKQHMTPETRTFLGLAPTTPPATPPPVQYIPH